MSDKPQVPVALHNAKMMTKAQTLLSDEQRFFWRVQGEKFWVDSVDSLPDWLLYVGERLEIASEVEMLNESRPAFGLIKGDSAEILADAALHTFCENIRCPREPLCIDCPALDAKSLCELLNEWHKEHLKERG